MASIQNAHLPRKIWYPYKKEKIASKMKTMASMQKSKIIMIIIIIRIVSIQKKAKNVSIHTKKKKEASTQKRYKNGLHTNGQKKRQTKNKRKSSCCTKSQKKKPHFLDKNQKIGFPIEYKKAKKMVSIPKRKTCLP